MKKHTIKSLMVGVFLSISAAPLYAGLISINGDGFAAGTVLNNAYSGVTLSAFGSSTDGNVYARASVLATTGGNVFGNSSAFDPLWIDPGRTLRMDILGGTDFVSIDIIANDDNDAGQLSIYNSSDILLGNVSTAVLSTGQVQTLSFSMLGIAYFTATGLGGDNVALDSIVYSVSEPGTLALLGLGLAGLGCSRRRQLKARTI